MEFRLSKRKEIATIVACVVIALLAILLVSCSPEEKPVVVEDHEEPVVAQEPSETETDTGMNAETGSTKTFVLTAENFKFMMDGQDGPELKVKQGDTVKIEFTSTSGFHDFVIDEFKAATLKVKAGEATSVEFVADKKGTFEYYCSVGSHRQQGMKGNLIVE